MYGEGHIGLNALIYTPIALLTMQMFSFELAVLGAVLFVSATLIPDFDRHFDSSMNSHRSNVWHIVPIKHRGFTHTIEFALLIGGPMGAFFGYYTPMAHDPTLVAIFGYWMVVGGILGHILGDIMTPAGISPSIFSDQNYSLRLFRSNRKLPNGIFFIVGFVSLVATLGYGFNQIYMTEANSLITIFFHQFLDFIQDFQ